MRNNILLFFIFSIYACNEPARNNSGVGVDDSAAVAETKRKDSIRSEEKAMANPVAGCYLGVRNRDSLRLRLYISDSVVTGLLTYDNYQYDGSSGTIKGRMAGDTIRAWYDFQAEGTNSVREMVFLVKDSILVLATGEQISRGDSAYFPPNPSIRFDGRTLEKINCERASSQ